MKGKTEAKHPIIAKSRAAETNGRTAMKERIQAIAPTVRKGKKADRPSNGENEPKGMVASNSNNAPAMSGENGVSAMNVRETAIVSHNRLATMRATANVPKDQKSHQTAKDRKAA